MTNVTKILENQEVEITPEMVKAGAGVLYELVGEASKEAQAKAVFLAMVEASPLGHLPESS